MTHRLHQLESFFAHGSDGCTYKVFGYEHEVLDVSLQFTAPQWLPTGQAEYRLDDGRRVDVRRDGSMEIAQAGVRLQPPAARA